MQFSDPIKKIPLCSWWWLTQKPSAGQSTKNECQWSGQSQRWHLYNPIAQAQTPWCDREQKNCKILRLPRTSTKLCFLDMTGQLYSWAHRCLDKTWQNGDSQHSKMETKMFTSPNLWEATDMWFLLKGEESVFLKILVIGRLQFTVQYLGVYG